MSDASTVAQFKTTIYANFAVTAVAAYDILLTFDREVNLVWVRPWHWANLLFLANRYLAPIQSALSIVSWLAPTLPLQTLNNLNLFAGVWVMPAVGTIIEALQILRVWVLYHDNRVIRLLLYAVLLAYVGASFGMAIVLNNNLWTVPSPYPSIIGSDIDESDTAASLWPMTWIPGVLIESLLVVLIICKTYSHVKLSSVGTPVLTLILRDGALYFIAIFFLNIGNVVAYYYTSSLLEIPALALSAVLCSRLFLNLRSQLYRSRIGNSEQTQDADHELSDLSVRLDSTASAFRPSARCRVVAA